jgi:hypothetical protein
MNETLNNDFLSWIETQVYNSHWQLDIDLLDFLLGAGQ